MLKISIYLDETVKYSEFGPTSLFARLVRVPALLGWVREIQDGCQLCEAWLHRERSSTDQSSPDPGQKLYLASLTVLVK